MRTILAAVCAGGLLAASAATMPATAASTASPPTAPAQAAAADSSIGNLAPTPPMGWNSWNYFGCNIDEELIRETADALVASGMRDAGYEYVNIDDCWMAPERDAQGRLQPDPERFPNGIDALADYVHARGLKLGIYSSAGTATCQGLPASLGHEEVDAQTWADWGVDYLKYDNCNNQGVPAQERYQAMGDALAATGRPIVYSICEWGSNDPWLWGDEVGGDLWRTTGDISDNWGSVMSLLDQQVGLEPYSGPNGWNDPDMLEVGNGGMTSTEYRAHMSLWSLLNAPLIAGNDLRDMDAETLSVLTDPDVVGVNQDWGGEQGSKRRDDGDVEVWAKPMSDGSAAVVLLNRGDGTETIATDARELGLPKSAAYSVHDLWADTTRSSSGVIRASVPSHGAVMYVVDDRRDGHLPPGVDGQFTPAVTVGTELPAYVENGDRATLTTTVYNDGTTAVENLTVEVQAPDGWSVSPTQAGRDSLAPGRSWTEQWTLVSDGTAPQGEAEFTVDARWTWRETSEETTTSAVTNVVEFELSSIDGASAARFWLSPAGEPMYDVSHNARRVLEESRLGFTADGTDYGTGLIITGTRTRQHTGTWTDELGSLREVPDSYNELVVDLRASDGTDLSIELRAYDEGVAFRYTLLQNTARPPVTITAESTQFNLDNEAIAYAHPKSQQQSAVTRIPVEELTDMAARYARPLTVVGEGYAATITEANQFDYTRMALRTVVGEPGTLTTVLDGKTNNPDLGIGNRVDTVTADVATGPFSTPWRTIVLGDHEGQLVEQAYLLKSLSPPTSFADTSWIQPGTQFRGTQLTTAGAKAAVDFAVARDIDYVLFDAGWYGSEYDAASDPWTPIPAFDAAAIGAYAEANGKKVVLYVNYRALWGQDKVGKLDDLFAFYAREWSIDGIKFGFVPVGSQVTTRLVYDWVQKAADNHLIVDIHDEMLPTGLERTYPNLLTMEAIHGDETNPQPQEDLGYLFTRMVNGTADHTWCYGATRNTSKAWRYAGAVVFFSALQTLYWYDAPTVVNPTPELWDNLPSTWDESRYTEAKIGEYATVVRRSGSEWWLGSLSAVSRTADIPLDFLDYGVKYRAAIFENDPNNFTEGVVTYDFIVDSTQRLNPRMVWNAGYAVRLLPATPDEVATTPAYPGQDALEAAARVVIEDIDAIGTVTAENYMEKRSLVQKARSGYDALWTPQQALVTNLGLLTEAETVIKDILFLSFRNIVTDIPGATIFGRAAGGETVYTFRNGFDDDPATYYDGRAEGFLGVDAGEGLPLVGYSYVARASFQSRIEGTRVQGSNDNVTWTTLDVIDRSSTNPAVTTVFFGDMPGEDRPAEAYRYYRMINSPFMNIAEVDFFTTAATDSTALDTLLTTVSTLDEAKFTTASWDRFAVALLAAQETSKDLYRTQPIVDHAHAALRAAFDGLVERADTSGLQAVVDEAAGLDAA